jgi:hypothetical protein
MKIETMCGCSCRIESYEVANKGTQQKPKRCPRTPKNEGDELVRLLPSIFLRTFPSLKKSLKVSMILIIIPEEGRGDTTAAEGEVNLIQLWR